MLSVSQNFGNQPAIDNFNLNQVLDDVSNQVNKSKNIIDSIRSNVQDIVSPRAYTVTPVQPAPIATATSISPMWVVIGLVAVILVVFIIKK